MTNTYITLIFGLTACIVLSTSAIMSYRREKTLSFFNKIVLGCAIPWICTSAAVMLSNTMISDTQIVLVLIICVLNTLLLDVLLRCKTKAEKSVVDRAIIITIPILLAAIIIWIILLD